MEISCLCCYKQHYVDVGGHHEAHLVCVQLPADEYPIGEGNIPSAYIEESTADEQ